MRGGPDAERAERERACNEAAAQERRNFDALQRMRCEGFRKVALCNTTVTVLPHCEALNLNICIAAQNIALPF